MPTMRTLAVISVLALITIAFEIYSDAALKTAEVSHTAASDPATAGHRPCGQTQLGAKVARKRGIIFRRSRFVS